MGGPKRKGYISRNIKPAKLNQEETDNLSRMITTSEIESVIIKVPANQCPGSNGFTGEFYQKYKEGLILMLPKLFQTIEKDRKQINLFHKATITLMPKPKKLKNRKFQASIFDENRCKNPQQNISNQNPTIYKIKIHHDQVGFIPRTQEWFSIHKSINVIPHE